VRKPETVKVTAQPGVEWIKGDLGDSADLLRAMSGCVYLINVASVGFGHAPGIVASAEAAGVKRALFVSTTAIYTQLNAPSKAVRTIAEDDIRASRLRWTIIRPTMIYGTDRDRNICRLIRYVRRYPLLPVFGSGEYLLQPIHVDDLAEAIVSATFASETERKSYNLSGKFPLSYNETVRTVASLLGRKILLWHFPYRPVVRILSLLERAHLRFPIKGEQILRLNENKAFAWDDAARDFGFAPRDFASGVESEIRSMGFPIADSRLRPL
jgi:uncharacterized protein YbjT (DUF2867 family)